MPVGVVSRPSWRCCWVVLVGSCRKGIEWQAAVVSGGGGGNGSRQRLGRTATCGTLDRLPGSVLVSEGRSVRRFRAFRPNQLEAMRQQRGAGRPRPRKRMRGA